MVRRKACLSSQQRKNLGPMAKSKNIHDIILIGGGGHCRSCIDVIELEGSFHVKGIIDAKEKLHEEILGYKIIATDDDISDLLNIYKYFLITIGQIKSPAKRIDLFNKIKGLGGTFPFIVSPLAYVSKHARIGEGTIIMHHALISAGASVGNNCIINSKSLVEHDSIIEDNTHISTSAVVNGGVRVEKNNFIGSNVVIKEGITIGSNTVIGSGVVVKSNIPPNSFITKN